MEKIVVICGPTATGKTALALRLAIMLNGEIVSADSRQVYRGMDIGTGKDLPINSKLITYNSQLGGYYLVDNIRIWGYDLADPKSGFSVGQYTKFAHRIIADIAARGKTPIIVGGTGLYIRAITDTIPTATIAPNKPLRKILVEKSVDELYEQLAQLDSVRAAGMNASDRRNPRRLIRAIEVAQHGLNHPGKRTGSVHTQPDILFIGLRAPFSTLFKRSAERVNQRVDQGLDAEVRGLIRLGVPAASQAFSSLGYREWLEYVEGKISKSDAIAAWKSAERAYIKRQITWFRKNGRIKWFSVDQPKWQKKVEEAVKKWHNNEEMTNDQR